MNMGALPEKKETPQPSQNITAPKKLSFKEKSEFESLEKELPLLQKEKEELEIKMSSNIPYEELQKISARVTEIVSALDEKEMRWLELSERV